MSLGVDQKRPETCGIGLPISGSLKMDDMYSGATDWATSFNVFVQKRLMAIVYKFNRFFLEIDMSQLCFDHIQSASQYVDPGYMSRKIRKFRTDKFDTRNKRKF